MIELPQNITELSALTIVCIFLIDKIFDYFNKNKKKNDEDVNRKIIGEMAMTNNNHLIHIQNSIENLNNTIKDGNKEIVVLLTEIKTLLENKK